MPGRPGTCASFNVPAQETKTHELGAIPFRTEAVRDTGLEELDTKVFDELLPEGNNESRARPAKSGKALGKATSASGRAP